MERKFRKRYGKEFPLFRVWTHFSVSFMERNSLTFTGIIPITIMGIISEMIMGIICCNGYGNTLHKIHDNAESPDLIHYFQQPYPARENRTLPLEKWILDPSFNPRA